MSALTYSVVIRESFPHAREDRILAATPDREQAIELARGLWNDLSATNDSHTDKSDTDESHTGEKIDIIVTDESGIPIWSDGQPVPPDIPLPPIRTRPTSRPLPLRAPRFSEDISTNDWTAD